MLYIISGPPRSGKSNLRKLMLDKYKIPGITTDILRDALAVGYPQLGIIDGMTDLERTPLLWPYFKGIIEEFTWYESDFVLEGTNFSPKLLKEVVTKPNVKICFLGYPNISDKQKYESIRANKSEADWTAELSDEKVMRTAQNGITKSKDIESQCKECGIDFYDTSFDFKETIEKIAVILITLRLY